MALFDEIMADTPLGYWRTASGADSSGNGLDLTPFGGPTTGTSLDLSDTEDASIGLQDERNLWNPEQYAELELTAALSLSFLMRPSAVGGDNLDLVRKHTIYGATLNTDGKVHAFVRTADTVVHDVAGGTTISPNVTYHVGVSYDGTTLELYVNGELDGSVAAAAPLISAENPFTVGSAGVGGFEGFAGLIDEVAVFGTALGGARMLAHYTASVTSTIVTGRYSGGEGNTTGALSLGGEEGGPLVGSDLFSDPSGVELAAGLTDYRCVYLRAPGAAAVTDVRVWMETITPESDTHEAIAEDTSNPAQTVASPTTEPTGLSWQVSAFDSGTALTLGDLDAGEAVPFWIRRTVDAAAAGGTRTLTLTVAWDDGDPQETTIDISYLIVVPVTLYVDADHPDRSDAWTRDEAADDPDSPFATMQAAAMLLEPGDTMQVEPSTLGQANPTDPFDHDVYAGITHQRRVDGTDVLPNGANTGAVITVAGHVVGDVRPKVRLLDFYGLEGWRFETLQRGYDRDSGQDTNTSNLLHRCGALEFSDVTFTGGAYYTLGCEGLMLFEDCTIYSPYGGSSGFMDGAGFHLVAQDTSTGIFFACTWRFDGCWFEDVGGEDCIQWSGGPIELDGALEVLGCTFFNIQQAEGAGAIHTDCIQPLGGARVLLANSRFLDCDSPLLASDGIHGRIVCVNNLVYAPGGNGLAVQGTSEYIAIHNTVRSVGASIGVGNRANTFIPDFVQRLTVVNNVMDLFQVDAGSVIDEASVVENNIHITNPGAVTDWGTMLAELPEFGSSARLVAVGVDGDFELANDPVESPGIGEGRALTDLGLTVDELALLASDHLGRAYATPRDVGAFQSDPGVLIEPAPRAPYVIRRFPAPGATGVSRSTDVSFSLVPVPGQTIDPDTVTDATVWVGDATSFIHISAVVTLGALADGEQDVAVELLASLPDTEGELFPLVLYAVVLDGVADTAGSEVPVTSWTFRALGTGGAAITGAAVAPEQGMFAMNGVPWSAGETVNVYLDRSFPPSASAPSGQPVTSAVVSASSAIEFEGLTEGIRYVAFAQGRAVRFMVPAPVYRTVRVS